MLARLQRCSLIVLSVSLCGAHALADGVRYVDDDAAGGDGTSWQAAYRFLQDALQDADATEIRVAGGVYRPDEGAGMTAGDRLASFVITPSITVLGGFRGLAGGGDADDRDPFVFETVLSGDLLGNDGANFSNYADNSFHVVATIGSNGRRTVDGFTIRAGNADDFGNEGEGGGLHVSSGDLVLLACRFEANRAKQGGAIWTEGVTTRMELIDCALTGNVALSNGGAIAITSTPAILVRCAFEQNESAVHGGAIYNKWGISTYVDCTFEGNHAGTGNGGAYYATNADPQFSACDFTDNEVTNPQPGGGGGGAVYHVEFSKGTYHDCTFIGNQAETGGAIAAPYNDSYPRLYDCFFAQCSAGNGGAVASFVGTPIIDRCTFLENSGGSGGAVNVGADSEMTIANSRFLGNQTTFGLNQGGAVSTIGTLTVIGSLFSGNQAGNGGAIRCSGTDTQTRIINSTLTNNTATTDGGGIYDGNANHDLDIRGSIIWENQDAGGNDETAQVRAFGNFNIEVDYSCIQGWTGTIAGIGNFAIDPEMTDPAGPDNVPGTLDDDARLSSTSVAIDAGDPAFDAGSIVGDLDGHARVLCTRVDMGAYEFGIGDFDCNRVVNTNDFAAWDTCATVPGELSNNEGCQAFDFDADTDVDAQDFAGVQRILPGI